MAMRRPVDTTVVDICVRCRAEDAEDGQPQGLCRGLVARVVPPDAAGVSILLDPHDPQ